MVMELKLLVFEDYPRVPFLFLEGIDDATPEGPPVFHRQNLAIDAAGLGGTLEQVTLLTEGKVKIRGPVAAAVSYKRPDDSEAIIRCLMVPSDDMTLSHVIAQTPGPIGEDQLGTVAQNLVSQVAFISDSPVHVSEWQYFSVHAGTVRITLNKQHSGSQPAPLSWDDLRRNPYVSNRLRGNTFWNRAMAHYREGLALPLPMYQFLAFFKGCEALERLKTIMAKKGYQVPRVRVILPGWIAAGYPNLNGKAPSSILGALRGRYRDVVAHIELNPPKNAPQAWAPYFAHSDLFGAGLVEFSVAAYVVRLCFRLMADALTNSQSPGVLEDT